MYSLIEDCDLDLTVSAAVLPIVALPLIVPINLLSEPIDAVALAAPIPNDAVRSPIVVKFDSKDAVFSPNVFTPVCNEAVVVAREAVETPMAAKLLSADAVATVRDAVISPTKVKELENVASAALFAKMSTCCLAAIEVDTSVFVVAIDSEVSVNAPETELLTLPILDSNINLLPEFCAAADA